MTRTSRLFSGIVATCLLMPIQGVASDKSLEQISQQASITWRCSVLATILSDESEAHRLYVSGKEQMRKFAEHYIASLAEPQPIEGLFALILKQNFDAIPRHILKQEPLDVSLGYVFASTQALVISELKAVIGGGASFQDVLQANLQTVKNQYSAFNCRAFSDGDNQ